MTDKITFYLNNSNNSALDNGSVVISENNLVDNPKFANLYAKLDDITYKIGPNYTEEIKDLSFDLDAYIYDINLIKDEFRNINQKLKDNSTELKNMIQDMLNISKNSFVPATFSINASISSEENESAMKAFGVNEKINQTIELSKYRDLS